jgi:hypothetical protein
MGAVRSGGQNGGAKVGFGLVGETEGGSRHEGGRQGTGLVGSGGGGSVACYRVAWRGNRGGKRHRQVGPPAQYPSLNRFKPVKSISKEIQMFLNNFKYMQILTNPKRIFLSSKKIK